MSHADDIVAEARSWVGTPFHHQGRVKRVGVDCIGMTLGALHNAGARSRQRDDAGNPIPFTAFDRTDYSPDPNSARLKHTLDEHLQEITVPEITVGGIILVKIYYLPQHVGIVGNHPSGGLSLIHAYSPAGKVVEEVLGDMWLKRVIGAYRVPDECFGG